MAAGRREGVSFVAFFAAQTNEVTPEKNLPKGKPDRKPQGVFTWTLMETLAEYPERDLRPDRARGAAALCGEEPGEVDAAVRGRSGSGGLWRRGRRAGVAVAGGGDRRGVHDPGGRRCMGCPKARCWR